MRHLINLTVIALVAASVATAAEPVASATSVTNAQPVEDRSDDVRLFPAPPVGFLDQRKDVAQGRTETFDYQSTTSGLKLQALVHLPPGYSPDQKYPVLYLMHGLTCDAGQWTLWIMGQQIVDNLILDDKAVPMIVVMPNCETVAKPRPDMDRMDPERLQAWERFEKELVVDLIPAIEKHYPAIADCEHRGVAGLSMGGGMALNAGLSNLDTFSCVGGFSPAPNLRSPEALFPDPAAAAAKLKVLFLSAGTQEQMFLNNARRTHAYAKAHQIPNIFTVDDHGHDADEWRQALYNFSQRVFR